MAKNRLVCVSDVRLGYGSPQIGKLIQFLSEYYKTETTIIEPGDIQKKPSQLQDFFIKSVKVENPYDHSGRELYIEQAVKLIDEINPNILVICTTYSLPVLFRIKNRPKFVVYYYLETAMVYGQKDVELNQKLQNMVDFIIFTEENRAIRFGEVCQFQDIPFSIVYNCVNEISVAEKISLNSRNNRILYQGSLKSDTCGEFFFDPKIQTFPIDLFGNYDKKDEFYQKNIENLHEDVKYKGYVQSSELEKIRKNYAYSIVMWKPSNENNFYASPNKFFESIAAGVPPISTPNPQCVGIINRYKCGLVMKDWDFDSFHQTVHLAMKIYKTDRYDQMIKNCITAVNSELNWTHQIQKIKPFLKPI